MNFILFQRLISTYSLFNHGSGFVNIASFIHNEINQYMLQIIFQHTSVHTCYWAQLRSTHRCRTFQNNSQNNFPVISITFNHSWRDKKKHLSRYLYRSDSYKSYLDKYNHSRLDLISLESSSGVIFQIDMLIFAISNLLGVRSRQKCQ